MPIFGRKDRSAERPVAAPEWERLAGQFVNGEEQMGASSGWFVGLEADGIDHPCAVFLTTRAVYFDVRPDASILGDSMICAPLLNISRCGTGTNDHGQPRLVAILDLVGRDDPADVSGIAVDLTTGNEGRAFADLVSAATITAQMQPDLAGPAFVDAVHTQMVMEDVRRFDQSRLPKPDASQEQLGNKRPYAHAYLFDDYLLDDDETVEAVARGVSRWIAEREGKGSGEGFLAVTSQQVLFVADAGNALRARMPRDEVIEAKRLRLPLMPMMSEVMFEMVDGQKLNYFCSTGFCRKVASMTFRTRLERRRPEAR